MDGGSLFSYTLSLLLLSPSVLLSLLSPFPPPCPSSHEPPTLFLSPLSRLHFVPAAAKQAAIAQWGEEAFTASLFPPPLMIYQGLFPEGKYFSAKTPLSSAQMALHCLSLMLSQMANLCDLVIISLNQAATFGLEVVIHSKAAAFQSQPPERLEQWHRDISIMQRFHPFFLLLL